MTLLELRDEVAKLPGCSVCVGPGEREGQVIEGIVVVFGEKAYKVEFVVPRDDKLAASARRAMLHAAQKFIRERKGMAAT